MRRLALVIEYDGAAYAGWQRQPRAPTVQATVEDTLARLVGAPSRIVGSGRTDAGVHALGQVAHVDLPGRLTVDRLRGGLNALLPDDIGIRAVCEVSSDFHARRDARLRVYRFVVLVRPQPSVLLRRYVHHVTGPLDLTAIRAGAAALVGEHDFAAFRVAGTATTSTICHVRALTAEARGDLVIFTVAADRFLRQMVRRLVGSLLAVGQGAMPPAALDAILASRDGRQARRAAPPHGLYLVRVRYAPGRLPGLPGVG